MIVHHPVTRLALLIALTTASVSQFAIAKVAMPEGVGKEFVVPVPKVEAPLPMVKYGANNTQDPMRYDIKQNPLPTILQGMNTIWTAGNEGWQNNANGDGPETYKNEKILDQDVWRHNIEYVINVTKNRTDEQAIEAYSDDRRSKNYSVIDAFGPLTEEYIKASGAYMTIDVPKASEILNNWNYFAIHNDGGKYAGDTSAPLGSVVQLLLDLRGPYSTTNPSKSIFATPRPWRMNEKGEVVYKGTKQHQCIQQDGTTEERTYDVYDSAVSVIPGVYCAGRHHGTNPLTDVGENRRKDGGYPSGHTNAGYLAAMAYAYAFPERFAEFITRGSQMGENRILTGMHSPVDVIGARMYYQAVATYALSQKSVYDNAQKAYQDTGDLFGEIADKENMSLYDLAHQTVENEVGFIDEKGNAILHVGNNNRYSDHQKNKQIYRERMTYGFKQDPEKAGQAPIVPEGAELLLETRLPYLTAEQRRAVLYTTSLDSGYPILDESNGWGRLDLVMASDGYGAFLGDVTVNMDITKGRFNAKDNWRNDISGAGKLTKQGTGMLILSGNNSYQGGTVLEGGILVADSSSALGQGDVYVTKGNLVIKNVELTGNYTQLAGTLVLMNPSNNGDFAMKVGKTLYIDGGELAVSDPQLKSGDSLTLIEAENIEGQFAKVTVNDQLVSVDYSNNQVKVTLN